MLKLTLRSSVLVIFNNFLLLDVTDRSNISSNQKRLFFANTHLKTLMPPPLKGTVSVILYWNLIHTWPDKAFALRVIIFYFVYIFLLALTMILKQFRFFLSFNGFNLSIKEFIVQKCFKVSHSFQTFLVFDFEK